MKEKLLKFLYNSVDISGEFLAINEMTIIKNCSISKEEFDVLISELLHERFVTTKKCLTGRNFYSLTKRGEKIVIKA